MDAQQLKHLVFKNIGENVGSFSLPTVVTYLTKDQVEKWSAKVVEDTSQNTMKIKIGYVVKGSTTATSLVEVVNIKKYYDNYIILNICEFSTTCDVNFIGLVIRVVKLNTKALCNACKYAQEYLVEMYFRLLIEEMGWRAKTISHHII